MNLSTHPAIINARYRRQAYDLTTSINTRRQTARRAAQAIFGLSLLLLAGSSLLYFAYTADSTISRLGFILWGLSSAAMSIMFIIDEFKVLGEANSDIRSAKEQLTQLPF